jgi:perosamine synthetase
MAPMSQRKVYLPFHTPDIGDEEITAVAETLRSGWLTTGPKVHSFEQAFAAYLGASHAVAVNSCTAALHLALDAIELRENDEVLIPTMTFARHRRSGVVFQSAPCADRL